MSGKVFIFLLLCFPVLLLTSCDSRPEQKYVPSRGVEKPSYGDALVDGTIGEPSNLIPILASDSASHEVAGLIYNGLVKYDKNLNLEGDLAESWEISGDGLTITFHLRRGVKWHDGAEFTSRDVLYTYRVTIDPKTPTAYAEDFKQVKKAEAPDPYTFRVTLRKTVRPGPGILGDVDPSGPSAGGQGYHQEPALPEPGRHRSLPLQGMDRRAEGRAGVLSWTISKAGPISIATSTGSSRTVPPCTWS